MITFLRLININQLEFINNSVSGFEFSSIYIWWVFEKLYYFSYSVQNEDDIMQICTLTETEIAVIKWYQPLSGLYKSHNNSQERYFAYIIERKETVEEKFNVFYSNHVVVVGLDKYITSSEYVCALLWYAIYPTRIVNMQVSIHC